MKNAQNAGAIAVVVGQNNPFAPTAMGGGDPTITIPSLMISQSNRNAISTELAAAHTVNVTLSTDPATREDSYRWLIGEDATAFGSAIRDMWTPTCLNMPGKVSDAEYYCATDDAGGVHRNSGVNNHAYALLVDGGTYNGRTITGIGLTKAAHIFWRAQTDYQAPTTDFTDQAASLASSCDDLMGQQVDGLSVDGAPENATSTRDTQAAHDHGRRLRPGRGGERGRRVHAGADAVQLPAAAGQERAGSVLRHPEGQHGLGGGLRGRAR